MAFSFRNISNSIGKFFLGNSIPGAGLWSWARPGEWGKGDLLFQYTRVVYTVVSAIAEDAAKIDFEIKKGEMPVKKHAFLDLIKKPNPDYSQFQFLELHFTYLKLMGESYWYVVRGKKFKQPKELYLIRPDLMKVVVDEQSPTGEVEGYVMTKPDGTKIPFDKEEILHFKMPNPWDRYYGMGPVQAAKTYIQTEDFASDWTKNSMFNSGRPSGVLQVKGTVEKESFDALKRQFKEEYSGTQNAGKTLFLRGGDGIDYQKLGMELGEIALKELKDMSRDDIMMMFRVSKTMLGISEGVTLNNARESREMFRESITMSEWDRLNDHLNAFLIPEWGPGVTLGYKKTVYKTVDQELSEDEKGHNKWLTVNDVRKKRNLKPLPGGDVIYHAINLVPMVQESAELPEETEQPNDGTPPADDENGDTKTPKKGVKKKELRQQRVDNYKKLFFDIQTKWEERYKKAMVREFNTQEKEILERNTKAAFQEWLFDINASKLRIIGELVPMGSELMKAAGEYALELADDTEATWVLTQEILQYIEDRIVLLATETNDATVLTIQETIAEGVTNGESVAQLRKRIKAVYDEATTVRAERIARTESLAASNEGALEAYRQSPVVTAKEWSAEANACEFCKALDGKIIGLNEDFAKLGQGVEAGDKKMQTNYEDIAHPPLHANCRCALLPVA